MSTSDSENGNRSEAMKTSASGGGGGMGGGGGGRGGGCAPGAFGSTMVTRLGSSSSTSGRSGDLVFLGFLGLSGMGHICIVMAQSGSTTVSHTCGRMMSPLGPTKS